eukprot:scaffold5.g670.t1
MADKIPVTVVTGWLGAGKTTLINAILSGNHGKKIAVIENEFGEVGIDDALVMESKEEIFEMNNGCVCCTVAQTFFVDEDLKTSLRLDAILTVVDAKHTLAHLEEEKPDGVVNEAVQQARAGWWWCVCGWWVAFADRVLLNKVDLVGPGDKAAIVDAIRVDESHHGGHHHHHHEHAHHHHRDSSDCSECAAEAADCAECAAGDAAHHHDHRHSGHSHRHDSRVSSVGIQVPGDLDMRRLNAWLSNLLQFGSSSEGLGRPWQPGEPRVNRVVFIGKDLDRAELNAGFRTCLVGTGGGGPDGGAAPSAS